MKIPLTQGKFAVVGPRDYKYLMQWKWHCDRGYALRSGYMNGIRPKIRMHRAILERLGFKDFEECDHINRNKLDNRRLNLRPVTHRQNMYNQNQRGNNTSGYTGVSWYKNYKKWRVQIPINGRNTHVGYFDDIEEAKRVRDKVVKKHYGEFAALNKE